jgi:hypothetical protein
LGNRCDCEASGNDERLFHGPVWRS